MEFTKEQRSVIETRDRDILVSAAAGSGKTAVLVERIIQRVLDQQAPVNIDQLLVMTFTEAAAAQMKERIGTAIERCLKEEPNSIHLQKQSLLIHQAPITTIHGFCLNVVRNHFHEIDLDPCFRVADEGECKLLKADVMEQILNAAYEEADADFLYMTECYGAKKSDSVIEDQVTSLYGYAMSHPFPEKWLQDCKAAYQLQDVKSIEELPWVKAVTEDVRQTLSDLSEQAEFALQICEEPDGPQAYQKTVVSDIEYLRSLMKCHSYEEYSIAFSNITFEKLGRVKAGDGTDPDRQELVKTIRDRYKKLTDRLKEQYFYESPELLLRRMRACERPVSALIDLTIAYIHAYDTAKRDKNIIDFSDMEHMALQILLTPDEQGNMQPSKTAIEYRDYYAEILVDEYQDSNLVQEYLIRSISREQIGQHNVFMVGDVKQSIYRFRLARPELFMEKYHTYPLLGTVTDQNAQGTVRIDLHRNFRSRDNVLNTVNLVFTQIMRREIGGIDYDDTAALYCGADYPAQDRMDLSSELLLVEMKPERSEEEPAVIEDLPDAKEAEARAIANRIRELIQEGQVWDKQTNTYRAVRYSDIVILLRTNKGYDETYSRILQEAGIPTHIASKTGYFTTTEVETLLAYLRILDNPLQDIPLAAVMKSMFGGFTDEELAYIRAAAKKRLFFYALQEYRGESALQDKIQVFLETIQYYREKIPYTSVYELIQEIVRKTGYLDYVSALPRGVQKRANVHMLLSKADEYGKTSYKGLFHFVRYIEYLQKYHVDYGEASLAGEHDDTVRIMSIHKSKGLEFPICILAAMQKKINFQDANQAMIMDIDYGIGVNSIDPIRRLKSPTLLKKVMQKKSRTETLAEELRILYVAMTRAEEKLIMTAAVEDIEKRLQAVSVIADRSETSLPMTTISTFTNDLDMLLYAFARHTEHPDIKVSRIQLSELVSAEVIDQVQTEQKRIQLLSNEHIQLPDEARITEHFAYHYPYGADEPVRMKVSVSELKLQHMEEESDDSDVLFPPEDIIPCIPQFISQKETVSAVQRGTAYHKLLELLDYSIGTEKEAVSGVTLMQHFKELCRQGHISEELLQVIRPSDMETFRNSSIGKRMGTAFMRKTLYREQPFVLGVDADQVYEYASKEETVLVQGIIDAYFEEDGALVVVDYKTDRVQSGEELVSRYKTQLDYYAQALEQLTGKVVKEKIIYSFALGREISLVKIS